MTFLSSVFAGTAEGGRPSASVRLRILIAIRWVAVIGQALTILIGHFLLGLDLPLGLALTVVGASVLVNFGLSGRARARLTDRDAALFLGYDLLQLGLLLFLTGGLENPFSILMIAPIAVAGMILSRRSIIALSLLGIAQISGLALFHLPLPWNGAPPALPATYMFGLWIALVLSMSFIAAYVWIVVDEARRMRDAVAETQLALAREQQISAVGALAAAAAHELGSPLGTIAVIAKELARELPPDSPHAEDAALLVSQSERCARILAALSHHPGSVGGSGAPPPSLPISALAEAAGLPHHLDGIHVIYATTSNDDTSAEPLVPHTPEIMHGLGNLIQNAIQFARQEVTVSIHWDDWTILVDIGDDGPGFPPQLLGRVGQPYISGRDVSSRGGASGKGGTPHMGLGIFIAQSLLERTGARLEFGNLEEGGAQVVVEWDRAAIESGRNRQGKDKSG